MVDPHPFSLHDATVLVHRIRTLLDANDTAAAGQVIHILRLRFPDHPEIEQLEQDREALYHPEIEQVSFLEDLLQSLPSARILITLGALVVGVGILLFIAQERLPAVVVAFVGSLVIVGSVFRGRIEEDL
ncbi:hypothetical protein [Armatimonas sp.]|uniref:hypothetical protein n=1 Tax=Armatimonas sp. TaxID=1872638 RepID=UPI0037504CD4